MSATSTAFADSGDLDSVTVLLPALNESGTIGDVIDSYVELGFQNVLVMDGHSSDGTREVAAEHGADVHIQTGSGKGQAVREAFERTDSEFVLMVDGDGTYASEDAHSMLTPLFDGTADHTVGNRFAHMEDGSMSLMHRFGNGVMNKTFSVLHKTGFDDILSGYHGFTREFIEHLELQADGFEIETELAAESATVDFTTEVIPIQYRDRPDGSESELHPFKDGAAIMWAMFVLSKTRNPLAFFGVLSLGSFASGVGLAGYVGFRWVTAGVGHEILAMVAGTALILGMQLLTIALMADVVLDMHQRWD